MSSISEEAIRAALEGVVAADCIQQIREQGGKVLITLAVDVPTPQKPEFAARVKQLVKAVEGVKDVFVSFAEPERQAEPAPAAGARLDIGRIVAVGAGKGGVGKSTVAVNLAIALARGGAKVGLLDADIYGPSAAIMTGTQDHKAQADADQRVIPAERHGVRIVSIAFLLQSDQQAVVWRGPMVGKMVTQLLGGVAWGKLDYLVVDLPPGTGDAVLSLAQTVPLSGAVVVTTPQDVALMDVLKAIEMFGAVRVPIVGVVENMAGFTCPKCGETTPIFLAGAGRKAAERFGVPLLGSLPLDASIPPGGDVGKPIVVEQPDSASARAFAGIAEAVDARLDEMTGQGPARVDFGWQ